MVTRPVHYGCVGTNINCTETHVLLQAEDNESQVRIILTTEETETLIRSLQERIEQVEERRPSLDNT